MEEMRPSNVSHQAQQILDTGAAMRWNQLVWTLVDGLKQPYDVVAHKMTLGEIAQGLLFLELQQQLDADRSPKE